MRLSLVSFALAVASLGLAQHQARQEHPSVNPPSSSVTQIDWAAYDAATSAPDEPSTNAQRFARGLPPLKPRAHRRSAHRGAPLRLGTRVRSAPPADTSPSPPIKQDCNILVKKGDGTTLGFISPTLNVFGEYGTFQETQADALLVAFSYQPNSLNQLDMFATNSPTTSFPYVGGVVGYSSSDDDMGPGNSNYAYVAGVKQTPVGPAQVGDSSFGSTTGRPADYESAIWAYNPTTQAITAQWVNTDESVVDTRFLYTDDGNAALLITGDPDKLNTFLGSTYPEVTFVCVPATATPLPK